MKAKLTLISSLILTAVLFCLGCEPEPKTTAAKPPTEVTAEQTQPSQEQSQAEVEMMLQQELDRRVAEQQKPSTASEQAVPAEPVPTKPAEQAVPQTAQPQPQVSQPSPNDVVVTVNDTQITRAQVDEIVKPRIEQMKERIAGRGMGEGYLENVEKKLTQQATEALIVETLVGEQMKKHNIVVTDQEIEDHIAQLAARENMSLDDLKALVTSGGKTFEQWKQQMQFDKILGVIQLAQMAGFGTVDVNQADAMEFYQQNKEHFEQPEQVRASHILIRPERKPDVDPNAADAAALQKAQELLTQIRAGADFAQLAKENSACPSAASGGDLGFADRTNWVKPFSDAAFALQPGQVSDVVKTRFGYHIIKVTDRKEASATPFDEAKEGIVKMLRGRQEMELTSKYIKSLRDNARIIYAEGAQPEPSAEEVPQ